MTVRKLNLKWTRIVPLVVLLGVLWPLLGTSPQGQTVPTGIVQDPRPLTPRGLENVVAFTRLSGYVQYFHPSDEASYSNAPGTINWEAELNWQRFTVEGIRMVEGAQDAQELATTLEKLFQPFFAPTVRVFPVDQRPPLHEALNPPPNVQNLRVVMWYNVGLFGGKRRFYDAPGAQIPAGVHDPRQPFYAELGGGVAALVPLALWVDERDRTLPRIPPTPQPSIPRFSARDRAARLATVARTWNLPQHFYPYFDEVRIDWLGALRQALQAAATDRDELELERTLRRLIVQLQDGHGIMNCAEGGMSRVYLPPIRLDWVENRVVVAAVATWFEGAGDLKVGDYLLQIEGKPVEEKLREAEEWRSAATVQWKRYLALLRLFMGPQETEFEVTVQTPGQPPRTSKLKRTKFWGLISDGVYPEPRPDQKIQQLQPGLFYVDLDRITNEDFQRALPLLYGAQGIIFDMRGYPSEIDAVNLILRRLTDNPFTSARFLVPVITYPDHERIVEYVDVSWKKEPLAPRLQAKVAFLTDGRAVSAAETIMGIVEYYRLGEIVGGPTAGTNGVMQGFNSLNEVCGGFFTTMKVRKHDGSRHHGVGIQPTVPVQRTLRGVAEGRDEVLEKAMEVLGFKAGP